MHTSCRRQMLQQYRVRGVAADDECLVQGVPPAEYGHLKLSLEYVIAGCSGLSGYGAW